MIESEVTSNGEVNKSKIVIYCENILNLDLVKDGKGEIDR